MKRIAVLAFALILAPLCHAQSDGMVHVKSFPGGDVGTKVANAMLTCPAAPTPCILVIDASLANAAAGTTPSLCGNCYLYDFRTGPPGASIANGLVVDAATKYRVVDTCSQTGSDWGIRAEAAISFAIAQGWTGAIIDASCEPHNAANLVGGVITLTTATNPFTPVFTRCGSIDACTLFNTILRLAPGVWTMNTSLVLPSQTTLDGQSAQGSATGNPATMGGTVIARGASLSSGTPLIQYGYPTGTMGSNIAQAIHVENLSLWGGGGNNADNIGIYNAYCQDRCTARDYLASGFTKCVDIESENTNGGSMNSGPYSPMQCDPNLVTTGSIYAIQVFGGALSGSDNQGGGSVNLGPRIEAIGGASGVTPTTPAVDIENGGVVAGQVYEESWGVGVGVNFTHATVGTPVRIDQVTCVGAGYPIQACFVPNNGGFSGAGVVGGVSVGSVNAVGAALLISDNCGACGIVHIPNRYPYFSGGSYSRIGLNVFRTDINVLQDSYLNCGSGATAVRYNPVTLNAGCLNAAGSSQTTGVIGVAVTQGSTYAAYRTFVAVGGTYPCNFGSSGTVTQGDYMTIAGGICSDNGTTLPTTDFEGIIQNTEAATTYATPPTPTLTVASAGSTTWSYKVAKSNAVDASESAASTAVTSTVGPASLSGFHPNTIGGLTCSTINPCQIYETAGPGGVGWIGASTGSSFADEGYNADTTRTAPTAIRLAPNVNLFVRP